MDLACNQVPALRVLGAGLRQEGTFAIGEYPAFGKLMPTLPPH
jgi:hypothetical protein